MHNKHSKWQEQQISTRIPWQEPGWNTNLPTSAASADAWCTFPLLAQHLKVGLSEGNRRSLLTSQFWIYFYLWLWARGMTFCSDWGAGAARSRAGCVPSSTAHRARSPPGNSSQSARALPRKISLLGLSGEWRLDRGKELIPHWSCGAARCWAEECKSYFPLKHELEEWESRTPQHSCGSLTSAPHEVWHTSIFLIYNQFCYYSRKAQVYQGLFVHFHIFVIYCLKYCA